MAIAFDRNADVSVDPATAARIVESLTGAAWATDAAGKWLYVTPTAPAFRGFTPDELNAEGDWGRGWSLIVHPDDYDTANNGWRQALEAGSPYRVEHRTIGATGVFAWTQGSAQPLRDAEGRIIGWYGTLVDSVAQPQPPGRTDSRLPDMAMVHPHDRAAVTQTSARAFFHGVPQVSSYRELQPDGSYQWVELRVAPEQSAVVDPGVQISRQNDAWTIAETFGETLEAVQIAQRLEEMYGGAWALDAHGRFTYATPTAQTAIGMTLEDLNQQLGDRGFIDGGEHGWKRTVHPEDYDQMAAGFRTGLQRGEAWNVEYRILRANGAYVWHRVGARPTHDAYGRVTGWYGISLDIDVYKKTEAALRESEQRLQQLIDAMPAQIWCLTPEGRPYYVNERLMDVVGVTLDDLVDAEGSRSLADVHSDHRPVVAAGLERSLDTGEPFVMRYRQMRRNGGYRWTDGRVEPHRDAAGTIVAWYGVCFDVENEVRAQEELRLAQERLSRASQAASLAELSASIAHEVNQPLAAIVANSQACQRWLAAEPPNLDRARITLERIVRDANSASEVVSRVRGLFKQEASTQARIAMAPLIAEAGRLLADKAGAKRVSVAPQMVEQLPDIHGDPLQIQQVLINLMRNGIEASEGDAGKVVYVTARRDGDFARIEIADEGVGIADPARLFDAFFTTKPDGMGMGLAISRSIVEAHGGRLWWEEGTAGGTTFVFTLPLCAKTP